MSSRERMKKAAGGRVYRGVRTSSLQLVQLQGVISFESPSLFVTLGRSLTASYKLID